MIAADEYQALSDLLRSRLPPTATGTIVLAEEPLIEECLPDLAAFERFGLFKKFPLLQPEVVLDLVEKSSASTLFEDKFSLPRTLALLDSRTMKSIFQGRANWDSFYEHYPDSGGMFFLSRVGFDKGHNQALVHIGRQWLGRAGGGYLALLERTETSFREVGHMSTWMS